MSTTFDVGADDHDGREERDGAQVLVRVTGDVDLHCGFEVPAVVEQLAGHRPCRVALDASGVRFLDAAGLSALLVLAARLRAAGHRVVLRRPAPAVVRVLALTGTADLLPLDHPPPAGAGGPASELDALRRSTVFRTVERLVHDGTSWDDPSAGPATSLAAGVRRPGAGAR